MKLFFEGCVLSSGRPSDCLENRTRIIFEFLQLVAFWLRIKYSSWLGGVKDRVTPTQQSVKSLKWIQQCCCIGEGFRRRRVSVYLLSALIIVAYGCSYYCFRLSGLLLLLQIMMHEIKVKKKPSTVFIVLCNIFPLLLLSICTNCLCCSLVIVVAIEVNSSSFSPNFSRVFFTVSPS